ncbi:hypothetical protein [Microbacterium sp. SLBN-146]|uniref:hypothetical protein n=1 Tax=Microbacterium sp. SLBN-146 TaxID=2768457 RepID=UPI00114E0B0E|nr:hypothetical protein [Microbacterium sp. SLBN-146]TQJ30161.1 hypothetical protein FBY39_0606 [Microbacterium sp. SLBN-146]
MPLSFDDLAFEVDLPKIPDTAPVAVLEYPCLRDAREKVDAFADALGIRIRTSVAVPHGILAAAEDGQIEVFSASGAIRGRHTERLGRYEDERRHWPDVEKIDGRDGLDFVLGADAAKSLTTQGLRILAKAGIERGHGDPRVVLERWGLLDEKGQEIDAGPGRATVALSYDVEGVPLLGAGAKTNLHFDPSDRTAELARFFHVHRPLREVGELRTSPVEASFGPLLAEEWISRGVQPGAARIVVTGAAFGLLAAPAHLVQHHSMPVLAIEGVVRGDLDGLDEIHFARYLPLHDEKDAAARGFAPFVESGPGMLAPRARPSRKDAA